MRGLRTRAVTAGVAVFHFRHSEFNLKKYKYPIMKLTQLSDFIVSKNGKKAQVIARYALLDDPNSFILEITVSLIASRPGPIYFLGSYTSWSFANTSRIIFVCAI